MTERWKPQVGDVVYGVHEFMRCTKLEDKYDTCGYEITEEVVNRPYEWSKGGIGIKTHGKPGPVSGEGGRAYHYRLGDYGKRVFRTFEEAIPYAEELAREKERLPFYKKLYRHWRKNDGKHV